MERFAVSVDQSGEHGHVVAVTGELDLAAAEGLWSRIEPLIVPGALVVLDGTGMSFLDSSGLRVLLLAGNRATATGADFRLVVPQPAVQRVLDLAGAVGHLETREDVAAALAG
jgi:anti-sigma B factor antagonist